MKVSINNSELGAVKDAIIILEAGQRRGPVKSTGLDGKILYTQVVKNGSVSNEPVLLHDFPGDHKCFVFTGPSGSFAYRTTKALKQVEIALRALDKKRSDLIETALEAQKQDDKFKDQTDLQGTFRTQFVHDYQDALDTPVELDINPLVLSQIDIEKNSIPSTVLAPLLDTIIKDDSKDLYAEKP